MSLPRRFRSFSLRTLMVLVTICAVAVWGWSFFHGWREARVAAALEAISRENPNARIRVVRNADELVAYVSGAPRISPATATLIGRADLIRGIQIRARSDTEYEHATSFYDLDTRAVFEDDFDTVYFESLKIECRRAGQEMPPIAGAEYEWQPPPGAP